MHDSGIGIGVDSGMIPFFAWNRNLNQRFHFDSISAQKYVNYYHFEGLLTWQNIVFPVWHLLWAITVRLTCMHSVAIVYSLNLELLRLFPRIHDTRMTK